MGVSGTQKSYLCLVWQVKLRCYVVRETKDSSSHWACSIRKNALISLSIIFSSKTSASPQITSAFPCINHSGTVLGRKRKTSTLAHCQWGCKLRTIWQCFSLFNLTNLQCARHYTSHFTNINLFNFHGGLLAKCQQ